MALATRPATARVADNPVPPQLRACAGTGTDGSLWLAHLDGNDTEVLVLPVEEGTQCVDELFLRHLTDLIARIGLPTVIVAVSRADGRVLRRDRRLRRELDARLADTQTVLRDMFVVGGSRVRAIPPWRPQPVKSAGPVDR